MKTPRDDRGRFIKQQPVVSPRPVPTWVLFAWLIATAVIYYFAGKLILVIAAIVLVIKGWVWLCGRYPRTMYYVSIFLLGFMRGLLGGRRR